MTCRYAAQGEHLEGLRWAQEHGCPWEELRMCIYAAEGGHLDVLEWLRERHCPWDASTCGALFGAGTWRC